MRENPTANPASSVQRTSLKQFQIHGISSIIRDLDWLADNPDDLESAILANQSLDTTLSPSLELRSGNRLTSTVGDVVLFRPLGEGAYHDMETLWGGRVDIVPGRNYLGVICERCSTKFLAAQFGEQPSYDRLILQFVAQAGGIGYCTGYSPSLRQKSGNGQAADVEILGVLYHQARNAYLNTIEMSGLLSHEVSAPHEVPPTLLVVGTATDVGKTTLACKLLQEMSKNLCCAALKASGTAWYEDSQLHASSGAVLALNFSFAGLPTTYYVDSTLYQQSMYQLYDYLCVPERLPAHKRPPAIRHQKMPRPDVLVVEHGGDVLGANVPAFLDDEHLVDPVKILIICCESALALIGALNVLRSHGIDSSRTRVYAAMPLVNPHAFIERVEPLMQRGLIHGVVDANKPEAVPELGWRCEYTSRHSEIITAKEMALVMTTMVREEQSRRADAAVRSS